jgi:hypothetical protein
MLGGTLVVWFSCSPVGEGAAALSTRVESPSGVGLSGVGWGERRESSGAHVRTRWSSRREFFVEMNVTMSEESLPKKPESFRHRRYDGTNSSKERRP